ncbi:PPC domain-containing protein [Tundrisphaera sp. TA3]|uniref:PPC domain-containing protein n=1 Tax=Tundrisphaera sp. TA3 TaxID=3435775 RepID=UPI003EBE6573
MTRRGWIAALAACGLLATGRAAEAKPPTLAFLDPAGAARGQTATVKASGSFDHWPAGVWVDGPGLAVEPAAEKGTLTIRVAADAPPGVRWIRLYDEEGATDLRPFLVGTLPEVAEAEPNNDPARAQPIPGPSATINGRLGRNGDVDGFAVTLARGQTLVADLVGNRLIGSPMDGVLQVANPDGFVLAQNDDFAGIDPRIVFQAPADGKYLVRVFAFPSKPDQSIRYAGGEAFVYRLTLTTGGFLDHAHPLAVSRDVIDSVTLVGPNVPESSSTWTPITRDDGSDSLDVFHPDLAGTADLRSLPGPVILEAEPNDLAHPQAAPGIGAVCGRIDAPGDRDAFRVALKAGEKRTFRVESRSLGRPLDPVVRVVDAAGKTLGENDDARQDRDPSLRFTAPADGEYHIVVRDLNGRGGTRFGYVLRILAERPDFELTLAADRFEAAPDKPATVAVTVARRDGFAGPIEIAAADLPPGITADAATSKPGDDSAKAVTLTLRAEAGAKPGPFRIVGRSSAGAEPLTRPGRAPIANFEATTDRPWLTPRPMAKPAP